GDAHGVSQVSTHSRSSAAGLPCGGPAVCRLAAGGGGEAFLCALHPPPPAPRRGSSLAPGTSSSAAASLPTARACCGLRRVVPLPHHHLPVSTTPRCARSPSTVRRGSAPSTSGLSFHISC